MVADALINGLFALGGAGATVAAGAWQQHVATRTQDIAWRRSVVGDMQRRLVAISALGRSVPLDAVEESNRDRWKEQLYALVDEVEVQVLSLPDAGVRDRTARALEFMRHCVGYSDMARHSGESISVQGVLRVTTDDAKSCLANYLRDAELPQRPARYALFDEIDAYEEEQYQFQLEMEQERRDEAKKGNSQ